MSAPKLSGCIRLSEASMAPVVVELSTYSVTSSSYDYFLPSSLKKIIFFHSSPSYTSFSAR